MWHLALDLGIERSELLEGLGKKTQKVTYRIIEMLAREMSELSHVASDFGTFDLSIRQAERSSDSWPMLIRHYRCTDPTALQQLQQSYAFVQRYEHRSLGKVWAVERLGAEELVVYTDNLQVRVGDWVQNYESCPWSVEATLDQIAGLIEVLAEAQRSNVLHRRLSPDYIYSDENDIKLLDFSPCSFSTEDDRRFVTALPERYLSPERTTWHWACSFQSAVKADVYSLGVFALDLIYGAKAADQTAAGLLAGLLEVPQLHSLLEQMLREDPHHRPDFIRLQSYLKGEPEVPVERVKVPLRGPARPPPPGKPAIQANGNKGPGDSTCPLCGNLYRLEIEQKRGLCQACQFSHKGSQQAPIPSKPPEKPVILPEPEVPKLLIPAKIAPKRLPLPVTSKEVNPLTVEAAQAKQSTTVTVGPKPLPIPTKLATQPAEEKKAETPQREEGKKEELPDKPVAQSQASPFGAKLEPRPLPVAAGLKSTRSQSRCKKCGNLFEVLPSPWRDQLIAQRPTDATQIQLYCSENCLPASFKAPPPAPPGFPQVLQSKPLLSAPKAAPYALSADQEASEPMVPGTGELFPGNPELQRLLSNRIPGNPAVPRAAPGFPAEGQPGGFPGGLGLGRGFPQGGIQGPGQGFPLAVPGAGRGRGQNPRGMSKCAVCMREFQAPKPPQDAYSAYFLSFCGEECQMQYFSLISDENTLTYALQSDNSYCMKCKVRLEEASGVILPCNPYHKFCSNSCGKAFADSVFSGVAEGNRDFNFLVCPRCEKPIPTELTQSWLAPAAPLRPFPPPAAGPGIICDGCKNTGQGQLTTCVHWLCQQCAERGKTLTGGVFCPLCSREVEFQ